MNRSDFITAQSSEKLVLAVVEARRRISDFTVYSGTVYNKVVSAFVVNVYNGTSTLTGATSVGGVTSGKWFYDSVNSLLYVNVGSDPINSEIIVDFNFFFSSGALVAPHDLALGPHVQFEARIKSAPGYAHKIGVDQGLTSVVGSGDLRLDNTDGALDGIYDQYFFDGRRVSVYSYCRKLPISDAKIIFSGRVTNKSFDSDEIILKVKDAIFDLSQIIPLVPYTDSDNVVSSVKGKYKRWAYGRLNGFKCQSVDQIGEGYTITGTVSADVAQAILSGSGTSFLSQCSPGDKLTIGSQEFTIDSIQSNTSLTLGSDVAYSFSGQTASLVPEIPTVTKNREFIVTGHPCAELTKQVVKVVQFNRLVLNDTTGLLAGDFVEMVDTSERIEIRNVAPGNIIVLRQNMIDLPAVGTDVVRQPIQSVYIGKNKLRSEDFSLSNGPNELTLTIDSDAEYNLARTVNLGFSATFTNGSRTVTTADDIDLRDVVSPRDWISPSGISYTTFYEILAVDETTITLRTNFADTTTTDDVEGKLPEYVGDDTIVSADILGKTSSGLADDTWISTAAGTIRDILSVLGTPTAFINEQSFADSSVLNDHVVSLPIPFSASGGQTTAKDVIDKLNSSVKTSLTLDNELRIKIKNMNPTIETNIREIGDHEVIKWSSTGTSNAIVSSIVARYRHTDIDRNTQESGASAVSFTSSFVEKYIGLSGGTEIDLYVYDTDSAQILAEREVFYRSLGRTEFQIETDLRLEDVEIGDQIILNFARLYKRFGDSASRKKVVMVIGKTNTGERTKLVCTDISNVYNRAAFIADNATPDYATSDEDEKLRNGYITDAQGLVDNIDDTANTNLIV
jgi:hypothetical protein